MADDSAPQSFPLLPVDRPRVGTAAYVTLPLAPGEQPPSTLEGFQASDGWHPERRRFDGSAYVPAPRIPSPKEQYLEQTIEEELSDWGEGARRDLLE